MEVIKAHRSGVVVAQESDTIELILDRMSKQSLGSIVVLHNGKIAGIFTERDLLRKWRSILSPAVLASPISTIMTSPVFTLPLTDIALAPQVMYERRIRHVPVVDQNGQLLGIISARDVLAVAAKAAALEAQAVRAKTPSQPTQWMHLITPEDTLTKTLQSVLKEPWQIRVHPKLDQIMDDAYWKEQTKAGKGAFFVDLDGLKSTEWKALVRQLIGLLTKEKQPEVFLVWSAGKFDEKDLESLRTVAKTARWHAYERPLPLGQLLEDFRTLIAS